jgi:hypothetical protein
VWIVECLGVDLICDMFKRKVCDSRLQVERELVGLWFEWANQNEVDFEE